MSAKVRKQSRRGVPPTNQSFRLWSRIHHCLRSVHLDLGDPLGDRAKAQAAEIEAIELAFGERVGGRDRNALEVLLPGLRMADLGQLQPTRDAQLLSQPFLIVPGGSGSEKVRVVLAPLGREPPTEVELAGGDVPLDLREHLLTRPGVEVVEPEPHVPTTLRCRTSSVTS